MKKSYDKLRNFLQTGDSFEIFLQLLWTINRNITNKTSSGRTNKFPSPIKSTCDDSFSISPSLLIIQLSCLCFFRWQRIRNTSVSDWQRLLALPDSTNHRINTLQQLKGTFSESKIGFIVKVQFFQQPVSLRSIFQKGAPFRWRLRYRKFAEQ
jgi:hypothetical protein